MSSSLAVALTRPWLEAVARAPCQALHFTTRWNWLELLIRILPSKYMLKSRVRELRLGDSWKKALLR